MSVLKIKDNGTWTGITSIKGEDGQGAPSNTTPKVDGSAAVGTETDYARGDHVHPTDTSRASADITGDGNLDSGFTATNLTGAANELKEALSSLDDDLAVHKTGNTNTGTTIPKGKFIRLTGNSDQTNLPDGVYQVTGSGGIAQNSSYSTSNLTKQSDADGALNTLNNHIVSLFNEDGSSEKASNTSCNDVVSAGIFYSATWLNYPTGCGNNGTLIVIPRNFPNLTQIYIGTTVHSHGMIAIRTRASNYTFGDWMKITLTTIS